MRENRVRDVTTKEPRIEGVEKRMVEKEKDRERERER